MKGTKILTTLSNNKIQKINTRKKMRMMTIEDTRSTWTARLKNRARNHNDHKEVNEYKSNSLRQLYLF